MTLRFIAIQSLVLGILTVPFYVQAAGLVPCGGTNEPTCGFAHLIELINKVVHTILFDIAVPLAALGFAVIGAMLIAQRDKPKAWAEARGRFESIGIGFLVIMAAFVLIKFILFTFVDQNSFPSFLFKE